MRSSERRRPRPVTRLLGRPRKPFPSVAWTRLPPFKPCARARTRNSSLPTTVRNRSRRMPRRLIWLLSLLLVLQPVGLVAQVLPPLAPAGGGSTPTFPGSLCTDMVAIGQDTAGLMVCSPVLPPMAPGLVPSGGDVSASGQVLQTHLSSPLPVPQGGMGLTTGTSGGMPYFSSATTLASTPTFALNAPILGGGAGQSPVPGTLSGTTRELASVTGAHVPNRQLTFDANGNVIASPYDVIGGVQVLSVFGRIGAVTAQSGDYTAAQVTHAASLTAANVFTDPGGQTMPLLALTGSSSGTLYVRAPAAAGVSLVVLPAGVSDFSSTGGPSQVVQQTTTAGAFTVSRLSLADLADGGNACTSASLCPGYQAALGFPPENVSNKTSDPALGGSDFLYPTQAAVKGYVDAGLAGKQALLGFAPEDRANKASSAVLGTSDTLYPTQNAVKAYVDTGLAGKQASLGFTPENVTNKATATALGTSNTLYPTQNAVKVYVDTGLSSKQDTLGFTPETTANKATGTTLGTSDTFYPSQNAVKVYVDAAIATVQGSITWGPGLTFSGGVASVASTETGFLTGASSALACGASAQGKMQVLDTGALQYCDGATTALLHSGFLTQSGLTWNVTPSACTGDTNGGKLTIVGTEIRCASDIGGTGGAGGVTSVFGRAGAVVATAGDYLVSQITNAVDVTAANVFPHASGQSMRQLLLPGATSGTLTVKAAAVAGSSTLTLPAGATDFSSTGGAGQVVRQNAAGGALTVAALAFSDLTGTGAVCTTAGVCTGYQATITWGAGLSVTGATASVASTEAGFLTTGSTDLTAGAGQAGKMQVIADGRLQYTDGAATPLLRQGYLLTPLGGPGVLQASTGGTSLAAFAGSACNDPAAFMTGLTPTGDAICGLPAALVFSSRALLATASATFPSAVNLGGLAGGIVKTTVSGGLASVSTVIAPTSALVGVDDPQILTQKGVAPRAAPFAGVSPVVGNLSTTDLLVVSGLTGSTLIGNPQGATSAGGLVRLQVTSATPQPLTWDTLWSSEGGSPLPTTTTGGSTYDMFWFQYNATSGKLDLVYNSQLTQWTLPTGVTPGTYTCPGTVTVDSRGRVTAIANGTCGGGGGGATPAGGLGDVQVNGGSVLAADPGDFMYDLGTKTLLVPHLLGSRRRTYLTFRDLQGQATYVFAPAMQAKARVQSLPDEDGEYCVKGGSCFSGGGVTVSGTPVAGQTAEWVTGSTITGVAVTGSGSYVKATSPTLTTPTIVALANLTTNGVVTTTAGTGTLVVDTGGTTGTGAWVKASSPTLVTPTLGVATATTLNKVTLTAPATGATLTIPDGTTATLQGTDTYLGRSTTDTVTNKRMRPRVTTLTSSTTYTCAWDSSDQCYMAMTGAAGTLSVATPTGTPVDGEKVMFRFLCTNSQVFNWSSAFIASPDIPLPTTCPASVTAEFMVGVLYSGGLAKYQVIASN